MIEFPKVDEKRLAEAYKRLVANILETYLHDRIVPVKDQFLDFYCNALDIDTDWFIDICKENQKKQLIGTIFEEFAV